MQEIFNALDPPASLTDYLEENASPEFKYRQRAVLIRFPNETWHLLCCFVQTFSQSSGCPAPELSRRYETAVLFEKWMDAAACSQLIADTQVGRLRFDDIALERKAAATWHSEFVSSDHWSMHQAGLSARTQFESEQISLGREILTAKNLPFYSNVADAASDWLPFKPYHGQSDGRNREIQFFFPEFRAHITRIHRAKGTLRIEITGTLVRTASPLLIKGNYQIGGDYKHFEIPIPRKAATIDMPRGAQRFNCILTDDEGHIFDFREALAEAVIRQPRLSTHASPPEEEVEFEDEEQPPPDYVPAADRIVQLDHNSEPYKEAIGRLDELIAQVRSANDYDDLEDKQERLAELAAGRVLLGAPRVGRRTAWTLISTAIFWLVEKFADGVIGELGKAALETLRTLLHM